MDFALISTQQILIELSAWAKPVIGLSSLPPPPLQPKVQLIELSSGRMSHFELHWELLPKRGMPVAMQKF